MLGSGSLQLESTTMKAGSQIEGYMYTIKQKNVELLPQRRRQTPRQSIEP